MSPGSLPVSCSTCFRAKQLLTANTIPSHSTFALCAVHFVCTIQNVEERANPANLRKQLCDTLSMCQICR